MSEFIPNLSSSEINFTVGKVEKSVEQKIGETTTKIVESGILKKEQFATEQDRKNKADEIVESIGKGFSSYEDMVNATCDVTRPEAQKNGQETFDILKKSISVAMNTGGDQELQTRLFTGGVREILPVSWKYDNNKASNLDLTKGVIEVTITNPKIREIYKEIDNIRQDYNMSDPTERKQAATEISEERQKLLSMRKEIPDDQKSEWLLSKEYLRMKMGILDGELNSADGSADKADVAAVLGDAVEKIAQAAEKMAKAAEKQNNGSTQKKEKSDDTYDDVRNEIKGLDFDNKKQVLDYCRNLLNYLENSKYNVDDLAISGETTRLLNYITNNKIANKEGFSEVIREVEARLALQDSAFFMMEANGGLSDRGPGILAALGKIGEHGRFLTRDRMKFFFDNKDYRFSEAWDLIQRATYDYKNFLEEAGVSEEKINLKFVLNEKGKDPAITNDPFFGKKYINYQYDSNEKDKAMVEAYMLKKLGGDEKARKSLQLAQKMFEATDEMSVSNVGFINSDEFTEAIQFGRYREDDARYGKTKNAGPDVHRGWIKSLTPGWLRNFCNDEGKIPDPDKMVLSEDIKAHYGEIQAKKEFYAYHGSILVAKIAPLKLLLMEKSVKKPEEIVDMEYVKSKVDYFNKADPDNKLKLKAFWVAGLLQSNMMHTSHVWDSDHIRRFKEILTKDNLMLNLKGDEYKSRQEQKTFLTENEWKWIVKTLNLNKYFAQDFIADVVGGMFKTKFKRK